MSDVFISYSRLDKEFVGNLRESFVANDQDIWIDWEDIPPSQSWWDEIKKGISKANNVVVVLSPNSMASPICQMEIEYARLLKKRIIPVLYAPYDRHACVTAIQNRLAIREEITTREVWQGRNVTSLYDANDGELKHINFFMFQADADFKSRFADLFAVIRTDYAHKEQHTTLQLRALEWNRRERDASFVLLDSELAHAQAWLEASTGKEPAPSELQRDYISASQKRTRQLRNIRRASILGTAAAGIALIFALGASLVGIQANQSANAATTREANANLALATVTPALSTATAVAQLMATADQRLTEIPPTLTQVADLQIIIETLGDTLLQDSNNLELQRIKAKQLVEWYPNEQRAYMVAGLISAQQGRYDEAIQYYDQAIALDPTISLVYIDRSLAHFKQGDYASALQDSDQGLALDASNYLGYQVRGNIYFEIKNYVAAAADFSQAIALTPENPSYYFSRGSAYDALGNSEAALADYTQAITLEPTFYFAYNDRATLYRQLGNNEAALADLNQAIALKADFAQLYYNRSLIYQDQDDNEAAIADLNQAIQLDPTMKDAYSNRAILWDIEGNYQAALADFSQVIRLDPNQAEAYYQRGIVEVELEDLEAAIADFTQAITLNPQYADAYNNRSYSYYLQDDYDHALQDATQAIALAPDDPTLYESRCSLYLTMEQWAEGIADCEKALEIDPTWEYQPETQELLTQAYQEVKK